MLIREGRPTINFLDSYRAHYGGHEDVVLRRVEPVSGQAATLRIELACGRPEFRHFLFSHQDSPQYPSADNTFIARFGEGRAWKGTARPVYEDGPGPTTYEIGVTLQTAQENAAKGEPLPSRYMVKITPALEFESRAPESWAGMMPTAEERRFAEATWGEKVKGAESDYDKAKALAKALCHELWPHSGWPIDEMQYYSPLEMYRAMVSLDSSFS